MGWLWWIVGVAIAIILGVAVLSYVCYRIVFYSKPRKPLSQGEYGLLDGDVYDEFKNEMMAWIDQVRELKHEDLSIRSFDGLTLRAKYYERFPGAPIELLFNGYRGNAERDLCGGVERCFRLERNVMIINQRASGASDGHVISFGINESRDCAAWVDYAIKKFGDDVKLIIGGVSMGASTVMLAAGRPLPKNVIGVLADCGYTSAREIIQKVMRKDMHLPTGILYPFVKLGARIYGGFKLEEDSALEAVQRCELPIVFAHGDNDDFVPYEMGCRLYEKCTSSKKRLVTIHGAGHGLAFPKDQDGYVNALKAVRDEWGLK